MKVQILLVFFLFVGAVKAQPFLPKETDLSDFSPIIGLKPHPTAKSNSIDSTFVFSSDTLNLPFFDDFSTNKFQLFQGNYAAPGVTSQTYYRLLFSSSNLPNALS